MKPETAKFLDKADRSIRATSLLIDGGEADSAVSRGYYAMLQVACALLVERGLTFRKHSAVHAALGQHFAKAGELDPKYHRWLLDSFDLRAAGDYGLDASLNLDDAKRVLERAVDFRDAARALILGSSKRG